MSNRYINIKNLKIIALSVDICFLVIHVAMFLLFWHYGITPMYRFNIFSVALYAIMPAAIIGEKHKLYVYLVYLEVVLHMTLSVYFTGWRSDFQVSLVGFNVFLFYSELLAHALKISNFRGLWLSGLTMLLYIAACVADYLRAAPYPLPPEVAYYFRIGWGATVFTTTVFFMNLFVYLMTSSQDLLANKARRDSLTGLPNRYLMADLLDEVKDRPDAGRYWLAMADLDGFKQVNDIYGHNCGDYVLRELADVIRGYCTGVDMCRWGGEEFLMMGQTRTDMREVVARLNRLRRRVECHGFIYEGQLLHLTITIGVADYRSGDSTEAWVDRADVKLYEGKCAGKNRVVA